MEEKMTFGQKTYSKDEEHSISQRLNMVLGPEYISHRQGPGGSRVHYIEGNKAVELANKIFGYNGWAMELREMTLDYIDEANGRYNVGISATVRITLKDGSFREDIGYGSMQSARSKGEAFEKSKKEAVTDGMKRCLRLFGSALGNCMYDKMYLKDIQKCQSNQRQAVEESRLLRPTTNFHQQQVPLPEMHGDAKTPPHQANHLPETTSATKNHHNQHHKHHQHENPATMDSAKSNIKISSPVAMDDIPFDELEEPIDYTFSSDENGHAAHSGPAVAGVKRHPPRAHHHHGRNQEKIIRQ